MCAGISTGAWPTYPWRHMDRNLTLCSSSHQMSTAGRRVSFALSSFCWNAKQFCLALSTASMCSQVHESWNIQEILIFPGLPQSLALTLFPPIWYRCPTYGWELHRHSFSALAQSLNFCCKHHPLHKASTLIWTKSCAIKMGNLPPSHTFGKNAAVASQSRTLPLGLFISPQLGCSP